MKHIFIVIIISILSIVKAFSSTNIHYTVSFPDPHTHYMEIHMMLEGFNEKQLKLKMPVWAPGSYLVREFAKNVEDFQIKINAQPAKFEKSDKNTWLVNLKDKNKVEITYKVYANELSVRTSFVNDLHAYINGTSSFMYVDGLKEQAITLNIKPYEDWKVISTGLKSGKDSWELLAENYDQLADSPIEIGNHKVFDFTAAGTLHHVAMVGEGNYNEDTLKKDMAKIIEAATKVFNDAPNKEYTFIIHNITVPSGGLEHSNSTTLQVNRWTYSPRKNYKDFLSLVAHEYFHLWNVKRLRPVQLGPFDYDKENYTSLLWVMEGFTSYYDEHLLRRCAFVNEKEYLENFAEGISAIENQPGNKVQSAAESSFDAWIKLYRPNENSYNNTISYYSKGLVLAGIIDLEILNSTAGEKSLDDVMRYLYENYYKKGNKGIAESDMQKAMEKIAGKSMEQFFKEFVYGTKILPYSAVLDYAGLTIKNENPDSSKVALGAMLVEKEGKLFIKSVIRGSSAYEAGLNAEDEVIAVNGYRVNNDKLNKILSIKNPGNKIKIIVSRDDIIKSFDVILKTNTNFKYKISKKEKISPLQEKIYKKWLFVNGS